MTILLTGSTGFLGKHLKARLERDGHSVTCLLRNQYPHGFDRHDLIVNAAADLDRTERMLESNVYLVMQLLQKAVRDGSRVVQIGSSSETGPVASPRSETTFCEPSNLYEATKLAATNLCLGYAGQYDLDVVVARPFTLYGSDDKPRKLLPTLWRAFCEGKPVDLYPGAHDWTHVDDFVEGIVLLLNAPKAATKGQIYHFGTGISTSNREVVQLFEGAVGSQLSVTFHPYRLYGYDVLEWAADSTKARSTLGWKPAISLHEGVGRFVMEEWFKEDTHPGL